MSFTICLRAAPTKAALPPPPPGDDACSLSMCLALDQGAALTAANWATEKAWASAVVNGVNSAAGGGSV